MNSKNRNLPYLILGVTILLFFGIIFASVKPNIEEYSESTEEKQRQEKTLNDAKREAEKKERQEKEKSIKIQNLKQIYESPIKTKENNLSVFGDMFDKIITKAQSNNLLIRSIEYDMNPEIDPIVEYDPEHYNVCELKFFFVCKYIDLLSFITDINNNFDYLVYISRMNIIDYSERPEYLLAKVSITLYSAKKS